jgi:hypothetical protein
MVYIFRSISFFSFLLLIIFAQAQDIQSPDSFLGYSLGTHYTPHYRMVEYIHYLAGVSSRIKVQEYGTTNEGRPLLLCFVSSEDNLAHLEDIRSNNFRLTGSEPSKPGILNTSTPVIVWLSYNVHGNEPSSSEAAMKTLYEILSHADKDYKNILSGTVLILDPCINPDGRDRYVNFYNQASGEIIDPLRTSREHFEPWPGGRYNHYLFDLNRDWAWQTQKETKARLMVFNAWLPQVHVDFHEMGINSPYYFSPAGEPFHEVITPWQRKFQEIVGEKNAHSFEAKGWLYFNREDYDLLYPSYGDTYPTYNGSIGMTYEQAGGPQGGLKVSIASGDTLSLVQRIEHHFTTGMNTWISASENSASLLKEFKNYFTSSQENPPGIYKSYLMQFTEANAWKKRSFEEYLIRNGIHFGSAKGVQEVQGFDYFSGKTEPFTIHDGDLVINASQPKSRLLQALMEPRTFLSDSITYDITAWALPYAWGVKTYALNKFLAVQNLNEAYETKNSGSQKDDSYAYLMEWTGMPSLQGLSYLWKEGVKIRFLNEAMTLNNQHYPEGTLIITQESNHALKKDLGLIISEMENLFNLKVVHLKSAFYKTSEGFASRKVHFLNRPEVGIVYGPSIDASGFGEIWEFFDHQLAFPSHNISIENLNPRVLKNLSVLIIPNLQNGEALNSETLNSIQSWVRQGGKLILLERAINRFSGEKGFNIKARSGDSLNRSSKSLEPQNFHYGERERIGLRSEVVGAIFKARVDNSNPLFYGFPGLYFSLKTQSSVYDYFLKDKGWNSAVFKSDAYMSGFSGDLFKKQIQNSLAFGWQDFGSGSVVYFPDDPIFRSFWINGKLLLGNAVFMVGN